jgi:hypothetical protein
MKVHVHEWELVLQTITSPPGPRAEGMFSVCAEKIAYCLDWDGILWALHSRFHGSNPFVSKINMRSPPVATGELSDGCWARHDCQNGAEDFANGFFEAIPSPINA